jgi:hypothetical protein
MSVPATSKTQAKQLAADEFNGFSTEDFTEVDSFDTETDSYPDPINSDREVNEYDIWSLQHAQQKGTATHTPRKNPTERTVELLLERWENASEIPLHDYNTLQKVAGIGPQKAAQIIGAAVANNLIRRPLTHN